MTRFEPFFHGYRIVRAKRHGMGRGSIDRAIRLGWMEFYIANGHPPTGWLYHLTCLIAWRVWDLRRQYGEGIYDAQTRA